MSLPRLDEISQRMANPPAGTRFDHFTNADGAAIRYSRAEPAHGPVKGVAVLVPGFQETIERYYELMHDLTAEGYAVWAMDWRGQGGSERYNPKLPQRPNAQGYEHDAADLSQFLREVIRPDERYPGRGKALFAHSMGGNIALRYLHDYPGEVDSAVITAPMLKIRTRAMPHWAARQLARVMDMVGLGERYLPGTGDWRERKLAKAGRELLSDRTIRQNLQDIFFRELEDKRLGGPTFAWLRAAMRSVMTLRQPEYLKEIKTPILLASAGEDYLVEPKAHERAAKHLPNVKLIRFPLSAHSIWMESDERRGELLSQSLKFLERTLPKGPANDTSMVARLASWRKRAAKLASGPESRPQPVPHRLPERIHRPVFGPSLPGLRPLPA
jgi:lysophospholipase